MTQTAIEDFTTPITDREMKLTSSAQTQMSLLMANSDEDMVGIRIFVTGGGCGGMSYGMTFAESITPYDKILEDEGYKILVDTVALNYLEGCEIDYVKDGLNESFVFNNVFENVGGSGACGGCGGAGF